ncbi:RAS small monomeric GTPase [Penicillium brasilianum]|uniref:RAS small monomeric GTPase n=1 Tax=Penicillium brasilianum TaxID=104259 RepID=A0A1S9RNH5_PENBI|nr:RAS small monomeric GTPase [Penicillium brasilianum]
MADKISITICGDGGCEDSYSVTRTVDGLPYFLSITDTAGQEEYRGLWTASTVKSDAFLLVYDITNPSSLHTLDYFMEMINLEAEQRVEDNDRLRKELVNKGVDIKEQIGLPPPVKIVAGNKCDLKDGRAVPAREGLEYARKHGCGFMETSAREMVNIEETFALLVRRVIEARRLHQQGTLPSRRPPSRAGQSVHTTALPPTTTDAIVTGSREIRSRRSRFFSLRISRKLSGPASPIGICKRRASQAGMNEKESNKDEEDVEPRGCFFRQMCCCCRGG